MARPLSLRAPATRLVPACVNTISPVPSPARIDVTVRAITPIIDSTSAVDSWRAENPDGQALWHNWWAGPNTRSVVDEIDSEATHASWFENFPWTRLEGVEQPQERKPVADIARMRELDPADVRELLGDGSLGGLYERPDADVLRVWQAGVEEVRDLIENGWARA